MPQEKHPRDKALAMADTNPASAMVYAVLDLATAIRECGSDLTNIGKAQNQIAVETGGVAVAITDLSREIVHLPALSQD